MVRSCRVYLLIVPLFEEFKCKLVLVVDDPDEEEAVLLDRGHGQVFDVVVGQGVIGDGDTTSRVS